MKNIILPLRIGKLMLITNVDILKDLIYETPKLAFVCGNVICITMDGARYKLFQNLIILGFKNYFLNDVIDFVQDWWKNVQISF